MAVQASTAAASGVAASPLAALAEKNEDAEENNLTYTNILYHARTTKQTYFILFSVSFILGVRFSTAYTVQTVQYLASWILQIQRVEAGDDDVIGDLPQSLLGRRTVSPDAKNLEAIAW